MTRKQNKAEAIIAKLASVFNTTVPRIVFGTTGRRGVCGLYFKPEEEKTYYTNLARTQTKLFPAKPATIIVDRSEDQLNTLIHEFAHHLEFSRGDKSQEPPQYMSEVCEAFGNSVAGPIC
jgi:hypothetical protein